MLNRRKIKFVDKDIQGYLMTSLIALEVIMVIVAMVYLYFKFHAIFDENIYQIHKSDSDSIYKLLGIQMAWVVAIMSIVNFSALFVANNMWQKHISKIIAYFRETMVSVKSLSLHFPEGHDLPNHDLINQLKKWQHHERVRAQQIKDVISTLPTDPGEIEQQALEVSIRKLQKLLKFAN